MLLVAVYHVFDAAQAVASNALRGYKRTGVPMLIYAVGLWGAGLGGGYILGIAGLDVAGVRVAPMAATGFWLAAVGGMTLTAALVTGYLLRVSRPPPRADGVFAD
jgi:MATE family multidrug resistance protein